MHTLNITGNTPEELYFNVVKTLSIFLRGAPQVAPAEPAKDATPPVAETVLSGQSEGCVVDAPSADVTPPKTHKNAKTKPMPNDDISDVGKTIEHEPKVLTIDGDIRPRLQAIQKACTEKGWDMPKCVSYVQHLYGPFGIANAKQLKPEQFAEFIEASDGYLNFTVEWAGA